MFAIGFDAYVLVPDPVPGKTFDDVSAHVEHERNEPIKQVFYTEIGNNTGECFFNPNFFYLRFRMNILIVWFCTFKYGMNIDILNSVEFLWEFLPTIYVITES